MRYVIVRDDDTNAFTRPDHLESLYRPFRERGLPVNLSVIPNVRSDVTMPDGRPEGFLVGVGSDAPPAVPIAKNGELVQYLQTTPGYHVVQHGCHHDRAEFDRQGREDIECRLQMGTNLLMEAGFPRPQTFVAPHDAFSRASFEMAAGRFRVLSTGWFELRRLPVAWWPGFIWKKILRAAHWKVGNTLLLSHPGCLLSRWRPYDTMLEAIRKSVRARKLTVLVTHWWEYFPDNEPDEAFIRVLHQTADYLAGDPDVSVISFDDLASGRVPAV
jgi:hypothetical protein